MYIFTFANVRQRLKRLFVLLGLCLLLFFSLSILFNGKIENESVDNKNEGYPGEPIRVMTEGGFESLTVWEAILNHYSF